MFSKQCSLRTGGFKAIWSKTVRTMGGYFILTDWVLVGFIPYDCFTNYEEIYTTDAGTPDYHFLFSNTMYYDNYQWNYFDDWNEYYRDAPSGVDVSISTQSHYVYVDNPDGP